jgi:hypothetical protein
LTMKNFIYISQSLNLGLTLGETGD